MSQAGNKPVLLRAMIFSLGLILVFTLLTYVLPQVEGEAPEEQVLDLGSLTLEDFVAMGESLYSGKGTCMLCHNALGRAPDLLDMDMGAVARERLADASYQGAATDLETYLRESMQAPGIYVVAGFGKKGSNDTLSPMPAIDKAPIQLSVIEMDAIIAYLQAKDGHAVTVALPGETSLGAPAPAVSAEAALDQYGCIACHALDSQEARIGPGLGGLGSRRTVQQIRQSIIEPDAVVAEGFAPGIMPGDFAQRMTVNELEMIVQRLAEDP